VTTVTEAGAGSADTMIAEVVRGSGSAVRRANRNARRAVNEPRDDRHDTVLPQALRAHGPPSSGNETTGEAAIGPAAESRCSDMPTITKVRNKLERVSALKGWRMRWYMQ
jgi:hypothetical protein